MQARSRPVADAWTIVRGALANFWSHDPFQAAAALSYYSLFSLAPLVIVVVAIGGLFFSDAEIHAALVAQIRDLLSADAAAVVEAVITSSADDERNIVSLVIATTLILIGSTTALAHLHRVLNRIWSIRVQGRLLVWQLVKGRLWSVAFLVAVGMLLAASLLFNTFLAAFGDLASRYIAVDAAVWDSLDLATSHVATALLLTLLYKFLPDTDVRWSDAVLSALVATVLFEASQYFVRVYLAQASPASSFGASGSIVVFMLWIYVASLIILIGAEVGRAAYGMRSRSQSRDKADAA